MISVDESMRGRVVAPGAGVSRRNLTLESQIRQSASKDSIRGQPGHKR
jgi:hypothetical protein